MTYFIIALEMGMIIGCAIGVAIGLAY